MIRADGVTIHTLAAGVAGARPDRRYEFRDLKCLRRPWPNPPRIWHGCMRTCRWHPPVTATPEILMCARRPPYAHCHSKTDRPCGGHVLVAGLGHWRLICRKPGVSPRTPALRGMGVPTLLSPGWAKSQMRHQMSREIVSGQANRLTRPPTAFCRLDKLSLDVAGGRGRG